MSAFITIVVIYVLNTYAADVKTEWQMKAKVSARFIKNSGISDTQLSALHTLLHNL